MKFDNYSVPLLVEIFIYLASAPRESREAGFWMNWVSQSTSEFQAVRCGWVPDFKQRDSIKYSSDESKTVKNQLQQ